MKNFRSALFIETASTAEFSLPGTISIRTLSFPFAIGPNQDYIYSYESVINIYRTLPFSKIKSIEYKTDVKSILLTKTALFLLNNDMLIMHSKNTFHTLSGDFKGGKLVDVSKHTKDSAGYIGVQLQSSLTIYDESFRQISIHRCQCSYSTRDILLLGDYNNLMVMIGGESIMEVVMPDRITELTCDALFSKIYCSCLGGDIYVVSMEGESIQKMEYHKSSVQKMKISLCGEYLYTADSNMICAWSTKDRVLFGFLESSEPIRDFDIILEGNRIYKDVPFLLN
ncbi:hypothetical protein PAEPH01_2148 [Pancytospora epiphaga]|nr:hypothetical protein PAEPH01_2148 [Pancytospora epiphaga]